MSTEEVDLKTAARYYRFMRSWTMSNPVHAKVELITNAIDAWRAIIYYTALAGASTDGILNEVEIEEDLVERTMTVRDFAIGMRASKMQSALLVIGEKSAEEESRGTFSTGAKNVSQLGKVTWHSIKDGLYSSCYITLAGTGAMTHIDVPVTEEHRALCRLGDQSKPCTSGTSVSLHYAEHVVLDNAECMIKRFLNYFAMRDILGNDAVHVNCRYRDPVNLADANIATHASTALDSIHSQPLPVDKPNPGEWSEWFRLSYEYPSDGVPVERYGFTVPDYPQANAYFELYETSTPLAVPEVYEEDTLQFGITLASKKAIHEHSCMWPELRTNEDMRHFYGRLSCDYIDTLVDRYDEEGPTADNPVSIIDPSRLYGLNRAHPFVQWLLTLPTDSVKLHLRRRRDAFDAANGVSGEDVLNLVGSLEAVGSALFDDQTVELAWRESEAGKLRRAVQENQDKFVFVRDNDLYELKATDDKEFVAQEDRKMFVFDDQNVIKNIEMAVKLNTNTEQVRIDGTGALVEVPDDEEDDDKPPSPKVKKPSLTVAIIYSDAAEMLQRYRTDIDGSDLRITINMNSPCFMGLLKKEGDHVVGLEKVSHVLIETMVQAFTSIYVERTLQSAAKRNVVHASNAAAAAELKYKEEYTHALIIVEREMYGRVQSAIDNGALDDGVLTLDEVL